MASSAPMQTAGNGTATIPTDLGEGTLAIGNRVFLDIDGDGGFVKGTDAGIGGVVVSLFRDLDGDGQAEGDAIATSTTCDCGLYGFAGLAAGDYVVVIGQDNLDSGSLVGLWSIAGAGDANDGIDGDDNGYPGLLGVQSGSIVLTEGMPDGCNLMVDFGFTDVQPDEAQPPILAAFGDDECIPSPEDGIFCGTGPGGFYTARLGVFQEDTPKTMTTGDFDIGYGAPAATAYLAITTNPHDMAVYRDGVLVPSGVFAVADLSAALISMRAPADYYGGSANAIVSYYDAGMNLLAEVSAQDTSVLAVNDAPVGDYPATLGLAEDGPGALNGGLFLDPIPTWVSDIDSATVSVRLQVADGAFTAIAQGSATLSGNGSSDLTVSGSIADVNATVYRVWYAPAADVFGARTITVTTSDGQASDIDTIAVDITAQPEPPAGTDATLAVTEDTRRQFTAADFGFTDADPGDTLGAVVLTSLPASGRIINTDGFSFGDFDGDGVPDLGGIERYHYLEGELISLADLAAGLVYYEPAPETSGTASFTFQVVESGSGTLAERMDPTPNTMTLEVAATNDAPAIVVPPPFLAVGGEVRVNATGGGNQQLATVTALNDGSYLVAWCGAGPGDSSGVFVQRYDAAGTPLGGETRVNTTLSNNQDSQAVAALSDGGYVVTWQSLNQDGNAYGIYAQRFDAAGAAQGVEVQVNTYTDRDQAGQSVAALSGGGYVVVWHSTLQDGDGRGVYAQRYDAAGAPIGGEVQINATATGSQANPVVVGLSGGGYVIAWDGAGAGDSSGVFLQRYDASGVAQGGETLVNTTITAGQGSPSIAALSGGGYVVTWGSSDGSGAGIYAQRFDASGAAIGGEVAVNTTTAGDQQVPVVAALSTGGYVVTWHSDGQDGSSYGVYAQRYDASGVAQGGEFHVSTATAGGQALPGIAGLAGGGYVIAWQSFNQDGSAYGIYAQRYRPAFSATEQVGTSLKGAITVADIDAGPDDIRVTLAVDHGTVTIDVGTSGASIVSGNASGSVTVEGTVAEIDALLNGDPASSVTYVTSGDAPPSAATLTITVDDLGHGGSGGAQTAVATTLIAITAVNDAPTAAIGGSFVATEQQPLSIKGDYVLADDAGASAMVTATLSVDHGVLTVSAGSSGATVGGSGTASVTLTGTIAQILDLLNVNATSSVAYLTSSDTPPASAVLTLAIDDRGASGSGVALTDSDTATITIAAVDDAPTATNLSGSQTYTEDTPLALADIVVSDVDSDTTIATLTLSNAAAGALSTGSFGAATSTWDEGTGTWTVAGSIADVNAALAAVIFNPAANFDGSVSIATSVSDGVAPAATGTITLTGIPVNDAPTAEAGAGEAIDEDSPIALTGVAVTDDSAEVTVRLSVANGKLALRMDVVGGITAADIVEGANGTNSITLRGSPAAINVTLAALDGIAYTPYRDFAGQDKLQVAVTEAGADAPISLSQLSFVAAGADLLTFAVGDLNADGTADLVIGRTATTAPTLAGDGVGGFTTLLNLTQPNATAFAFAQFNAAQDDYLDMLAMPNQSGSYFQTYGTAPGIGLFRLPTAGTLSLTNARALETGDFNGDGFTDFILVSTFSTASLRFGDGLGGFSGGTSLSTVVGSNGISIASLTAADVDGDGDLDLVTAYAPSGGLHEGIDVRFNEGAGGFATRGPLIAVERSSGSDVVAGDFNGDGKVDLAVSSGAHVSVLIGAGDGGFAAPVLYAVNAVANDGELIVTDLNGDGVRDLVLASGNVVSILSGNGDGSFDAAIELTGFGQLIGVTAADVDGDGDTDLVIGDTGTDRVYTYRNDGNGWVSDSATIDVAKVNDAPTFTGFDATPTYVEGAAAVRLDDFATATDVELMRGNYAGTTLTLERAGGANAEDRFGSSDAFLRFLGPGDSGNLQYAGTTIATYVQSGGRMVISFNANATQAMITSALTYLGYSNSSDTPPESVTIALTFSDGNGGAQGPGDALTASRSVTVNIVATNDTPVIGINAGPTILENGSTPITASMLHASDVEQGAAQLRYTLTSLSHGSVTLDGVTLAADGSFTQADIDAGLVRFIQDGTEAATAGFGFTLSDGDGGEVTGQNFTLTVTPVSDAPFADWSTLVLDEDQTGVLTSYYFTQSYADADGDAFAGIVVTSLNLVGGALLLDSDGEGGDAPVAVTSGQFVSATDITAGKLTYVPLADFSTSPGNFGEIGFRVVDTGSTANGGDTIQDDEALVTIRVDAVNDAPTLGGGGTIGFTEGAAPVAITPGLTLADIDSPTLNWARIEFVNSAGVQDQLVFVNSDAAAFGDIAANFNPASGMMSLTSASGTATLAQWQAALRSVRYVNTSDSPVASTREIGIFVTDSGTEPSNGISAFVAVTAVNDSPFADWSTLTIEEDGAGVLTPYYFTQDYSDPEGDAFAGIVVTSINPKGGALLFDADGAGDDDATAVTIGQFISAADLTAGKLSYVPLANFATSPGNFGEIGFRVVDSGGTANGGDDTQDDEALVTIVVQQVNDAPTAANVARTIDEDGSYVFKTSDFGFSDIDGGTLAGVKLSLPANGTLLLDGAAVGAGQTVSAADIATGKLVFVPAANANGLGYGSFTFQVQDNGGAANGGADLSAPHAFTLDVASVNDAPKLGNVAPGLTFAENLVNATPQLIAASAVFSDVEGNFDGGTVVVSGLLAEDRAGIRHQGDGAGQIGVSGSTISYGGVAIGTVAGGTGASLTVTLNDAATSEAVQALMRSLTYANASATPTLTRTLNLQVTDAAGDDLGYGPAGFVPVPDAQTPFQTYSSDNRFDPAFYDLNGDGRLDIVLGKGFGQIDAYLKNANGTLSPLWGGSNPFSGIGLGYYASPAFGDIDGDGRLDLVAAGAENTGIVAWHNNGNGSFTQLTGADNPFGTLYSGYFPDLAFADIDSDGRQDFLIYHGDRDIAWFRNTGSGFVEQTGSANPFTDVAIGNYAAITFMDLDADGDLDLIGGTQLGLKAWRNTGTGFTELTGSDDPFAGLGINYLTAPQAVDYDGDGDLDLILGTAIFGTAGGKLVALRNAPPHGTNVIIQVTPENDAPSGTDKTLTVREDGSYALALADFGYVDPERETFYQVIVSTLPQHGTLTFDGAAVTQGQAIYWYDIQDGKLVFTPAADGNGAGYAGFGFQVRDASGIFGQPGIDTDPTPNTITFNVTPISDAPFADSSTLIVDEDQTGALTPYYFTQGYGDVDGDAFAGIVVTTLNLVDGALLLDGDAVTAGQFVSAADIAAGKLTYVPLANFSTSAGNFGEIGFRVVDTGTTANGGDNIQDDEALVTIRVDAVNDAPVLIGGGGTVNFIEGGAPVAIAPGLSLADIDSATLNWARIQLANTAGAQDQLVFVNDDAAAFGDIAASFNAAFGMMNLSSASGTATLAQWQAALGAVSYVNTSDAPSAGTREIDIFVTDGSAAPSNIVSTSVKVTPVNDAPFAGGSTLTLEEDGAGVLTPYYFTQDYSDAEGDAFAGIVVTSIDPVGGALLFDADGAGGNDATAATIGQFISAADLAAGKLTYVPLADFSTSPGNVGEIGFRVVDTGDTANGGDNVQDGEAQVTIVVMPVNDAPVLSGGSAAGSFVENGSSVTVAADLVLTDIDSAAMVSATIAITGNYLASSDRLGLLNNSTLYGNIVASFDAATGVMTLTSAGGTATVAEWQTALRSVDYYNVGEAPGTATRSFTICVNDGSAISNYLHASVAVTDVNDAPVVAIDDGLGITEDSPLDLKGAFSLYDYDAGSAVVTATLSVGYGILVATEGTSGATVSGIGGSSVTITGTIDQIRALLDTDDASSVLLITPNDTPPTSTTLTLAINDGGATGTGGAQIGSASATIAITPVNDAPELTGFGGSTSFVEGNVNVLSALLRPDVTVADPEGNFDGGWLTVTGLLGEDSVWVRNQGTGPGQIGLWGSDLSWGGTVIGTISGGVGETLTVSFNANATAEAIEALIENLTYANASDTPSASRTLTIDIADSGGLHAVQALSVTVVADNDAPVLAANSGATLAEGGAVTLYSAQLDVDDPEQADSAITYTVTSLANGAVRLNGSALGLNGTFTQEDINNGIVSFLHDGSETRGASFGFSVSDGAGGTIPNQRFDLSVTPVNDVPVLTGFGTPIERPETQSSRFLVTLLQGEQIVDDFVLGAPATLHSMTTILMDSVQNNDGVLAGFSGALGWAIYADNGGQPGALIASGVDPSVALSHVRGVSGLRESFNAQIDFGGEIALAGGTYWIALRENGWGSAYDGSSFAIYLGEQAVNNARYSADPLAPPAAWNPLSGYSIQFRMDAPVESVGFAENAVNAAPAILRGDVGFVDDDFAGGTLTITGLLAEDRLSVRDQGSDAGEVGLDGNQLSWGGTVIGTLSGGVGNTLTLSFNASATAAAVEAVIENLTYANVSDTPAVSRYLTLNLTDNAGAKLAAAQSLEVKVAAENDAPTAAIAGSFTSTEQVPVSVKGGYAIADADAGGAVVTATLSVGHGVLAVTAGTSGADVTGSGTGSVTLTGTIAQILDLLNSNAGSSLTYTAASDAPPASTTLTLTVDDGGASGGVGSKSGSDTTTITIAPIDDAAVARDDLVQVDESSSLNDSLFDDNGDGADADADGPALAIATVNGSAANIGSQIWLASGAGLIVQADGSFTYDPHGAFNYLPAFGSGASNWMGTDSFTYTLVGGGSATVTVHITGIDGDDVLKGSAGNDVLDGGIGINTLSYADATAGVHVSIGTGIAQDTLGAGIDTLSNFHNLIGTDFVDELRGSVGNNLLDGGTGADVMLGWWGNDTYIVDDIGDSVREVAGQGNDTIRASISYDLSGWDVENLVLTGTGATNAGGNALDNRITGNGAANQLWGAAGDDRLDGGGGADYMAGGLGDDVFVVDNVGDRVKEADGQGTDTVETSVDYTLPGLEVEKLVMTGSAAINATGNHLDNIMIGNSAANSLSGAGGNDRLNGGGGADLMAGGAGDDVYVVDDAGDRIKENAGQGTDTVEAWVSYTLPSADIEKLVLMGTFAIDGAGNALANIITGNDAANSLLGYDGADTLIGGGGDDVLRGMAGHDRLEGGAGADRFYFDTALGAANVDTIVDFEVGVDSIYLRRALFGGASGGLTADAFVIGTHALDTNDRIVYDAATGALYYDADGSGAGAAIQFATLGAGLSLTHADFTMY